MTNLGTILPTRKSLEAGDRAATNDARKRLEIGRTLLGACDRRTVGGEVRYYATEERYAVVGGNFKVLWFTVHADGDYAD